MPTQEMIPLIYLNAQNVYINEKVLKKLRAGDLSGNLALAAIGIIVLLMYQLSVGSAFTIFDRIAHWNAPTVAPSFGLNPYSRSQPRLEMEKPSVMPQQEYSSLTRSERRQLADPHGRDASIELNGYPRLDLRFNQVEFKTPKHGEAHGLPVDKTGKTPKIHAIALRDSLIDMPNKPKIIWYTNGQYQGGTQRDCDTVNLLDPEKHLIAVYQKKPDGSNLFLTTCQLTDIEEKHLNATKGNFVTERILREQKAVSTHIQENTNTKNDL